MILMVGLNKSKKHVKLIIRQMIGLVIRKARV